MKLQLKRLRRENHLTQLELGRLVGQSARVISSWERGETVISLEDAARCSLALNCTVDELAGIEGTPSSARKAPSDEMELIGNYRECDAGRKSLLLAASRDFAAQEKKTDLAEEQPVHGAARRSA